MISVIHSPANELIEEVDDDPVPAGDCRTELDWHCVAAAFDAAAEQLGWAAHVRVRPERRYVEVVVSADRTDHVARTTLDFYAAVASRIGVEAFRSIWVDFDVPATASASALDHLDFGPVAELFGAESCPPLRHSDLERPCSR